MKEVITINAENKGRKIIDLFLCYEWTNSRREYEMYSDLIECYFEEEYLQDKVELNLDDLCDYIQRKIAACTNQKIGWYEEKALDRRDLFQALIFFRNCQYRQFRKSGAALRETAHCGKLAVKCEKCGGYYRYAGVTYSVAPPRYMHECDCSDMCDDLMIFNKKYS